MREDRPPTLPEVCMAWFVVAFLTVVPAGLYFAALWRMVVELSGPQEQITGLGILCAVTVIVFTVFGGIGAIVCFPEIIAWLRWALAPRPCDEPKSYRCIGGWEDEA